MTQIPSPRGARKARIEIIPLIDIMFFLLATFVMVSLSMIKNQGITVNLPVAASSAPQDRKDYVALSFTESGEYYFNKEPLSLEQIAERRPYFLARVEQSIESRRLLPAPPPQ